MQITGKTVKPKKKPKPGDLTRTAIKRLYGLTDSMIDELKVIKIRDGIKYYKQEQVGKWLRAYRAAHTEEEYKALLQRAAYASAQYSEGAYSQNVGRAKMIGVKKGVVKKRWY